VPKLFISYRIADSVHIAAAIADRLARHFGAGNIFRDHDSLRLGEVYPSRIRRELERSDVVLALLGPHWLDIRDESKRRRLDDPKDWVRTELRMAFERRIPVVPVLLDGTELPRAEDLPVELAPLCVHTLWRVRHQSFESDVHGLIAGLSGGPAQGVPEAPALNPGQNVQHVNADRSTINVNQGHQINAIGSAHHPEWR
jgi:hypothetical protein